MGRDCDSSNEKFLAPFPEIYVSYNTLLVEDHGPFVTSYLEKKGAEGKNTFLLPNFITMLSFFACDVISKSSGIWSPSLFSGCDFWTPFWSLINVNSANVRGGKGVQKAM